MVASNLLSGVAQAAVAALLLSGAAEVWHLAALAALNGFASAFFFPAAQGAVPQTVPAASLQSANSLLGLARNATYITGAALGGLIVAATSPGTAIAVDAASYGLAALALAAMRLPPGLRQAGSGFLAELAEGWQEFRSRTWLWAIVLQFAFVNAAWVGAESVLGPVVADEELGGAAVWGLILATQSAGLVVGGLVLLRLRPRRLLLSATIGVLMTLPVLVALAIPMSVVAIAACAFAAGLGLELFGVLWNTTMQQEIPADRLSRVYSYDALGSFVLIPIGFAVVGPVANALGTTETLLLAATLNLLATLAVLASRDVRTLQRRLPPAEATAA
jgi:hypothetical protein